MLCSESEPRGAAFCGPQSETLEDQVSPSKALACRVMLSPGYRMPDIWQCQPRPLCSAVVCNSWLPDGFTIRRLTISQMMLPVAVLPACPISHWCHIKCCRFKAAVRLVLWAATAQVLATVGDLVLLGAALPAPGRLQPLTAQVPPAFWLLLQHAEADQAEQAPVSRGCQAHVSSTAFAWQLCSLRLGACAVEQSGCLAVCC